MKKRVYIFLSFFCICLLLSGCKSTTPEQKQKAVEKYLKKYGAEVEYMDLYQWHASAFSVMRDQNYGAIVKVEGIENRLIEVTHNVSTKRFTSNIQATQFIPNVEQKLREQCPTELLQNCEFYILGWAFDSQKIPVMSFEEYCAYDWVKENINPNRWKVDIFVWNLSDDDAINYVLELKKSMKEEGINCLYTLNRYEFSREKYRKRIEEIQPNRGSLNDVCNFQSIDFGLKKGSVYDQFLETIPWQYK